ncbi:MAG: dihydrodipicolinate synthase family protein [Candidatus Latescibacterota bacterium]|nr:dihydrodipicolinate synthase family protein [Candidatus Latescibacterota bacterium]MEC8991793.1 dihydrodipicolinate synthase family protein [Candidatus Latescibacterota bacterium]MEC9377972.1 dihydrodipicolinate synthase family protein [Candidatus Latescibacterota bacterium]MEE3039709.1 dihydrodipicolinate synthase family protein [Candidatus Latescibacterota bacterium]MEE3336857.1 dihydrodipicolinate synthase family protein [Candidatus Latescibacterota bacterium]
MVRIDDSLITAQTLETRLSGNERQVEICPRAKLTPSALDLLRARQIQVVKRTAHGSSAPAPQASVLQPAGVPEAPGGTERSRRFSGIFTPNIVIYDEAGSINYKEMERYIAWLIDAGIHGLYPNGSTGEFVRLSSEERRDVVRLIADVNQGRVPILAGASEANVRDVLQMAQYYADLGADAISLVPPYYYKISDTSLYEYFAEIARNSPLDILLYNIPQFTQELPLEIMEELLAFDKIFGTKDSSRDLPRIINTMQRLRKHRPDYVVLNGCEEILLPSIIMGANGGTIATSGIIPEIIVELYDRTLAMDLDRARELQYRILPLINLMLLGVNFPEGFKTGVAVRGFDVGPARTVMSSEERDYLQELELEISCVLSDMGFSVTGAQGCPVTHLPPLVRRS